MLRKMEDMTWKEGDRVRYTLQDEAGPIHYDGTVRSQKQGWVMFDLDETREHPAGAAGGTMMARAGRLTSI